MLAPDLAMLYSVPTKRLNEQVKRNIERFPERFMFQLTAEEVVDLRSQFATSKRRSSTRILLHFQERFFAIEEPEDLPAQRKISSSAHHTRGNCRKHRFSASAHGYTSLQTLILHSVHK